MYKINTANIYKNMKIKSASACYLVEENIKICLQKKLKKCFGSDVFELVFFDNCLGKVEYELLIIIYPTPKLIYVSNDALIKKIENGIKFKINSDHKIYLLNDSNLKYYLNAYILHKNGVNKIYNFSICE